MGDDAVDDLYSQAEAQRRSEAALGAALNGPPKPLKDVPRKRPESKRKAKEGAMRSAAATGPADEEPKRRERQPDEPTAPHPEETGDPAERAKDAMRKAGERNRRVKRPGASGIRGGTSED
jgi:hypothetical protein